MKGKGADGGDLPGSYAEWTSFERAYWSTSELERCLAYWRPRLTGVRKLWNSHEPGRSPRPDDRCASWISSELANAIQELARCHGTTLFSALLTAFNIVLSRQTGVDDILVGTPVANRTRQSARDIMGYFAGIVPLRTRIDPSRTLSDMLRGVHQMTVDCFAHAMPFAELVRGLGIATESGENPLFEVRFALQNHPVPDVALPGLSAQLRMRSTGTARFDLGCEITEIGDRLEVVWLTRRNLFSRQQLEDLHRTFESVIKGACREPNCRVTELMK